MLRTCSLLVTFFLFPLFLGGQSLGEVAKKEKKRREANKEKGVEVRVVAEDEISTEEEQTEDTEQIEGTEATEEGSAGVYVPADRNARGAPPRWGRA